MTNNTAIKPAEASNRIEKNRKVSFWYKGKLRTGRVERITDSYIMLETIDVSDDIYNSVADTGEFKNFTLSKIESKYITGYGQCQHPESGCYLAPADDPH